MGLFSNNRDPAFGDRIRAAIAMAQGDTGAAARFQALQLQRQEAARQQAAAQREIETRDNQVWGAKELGYSLPEISAMGPGDLSQLQRGRMEPYTLSPGSMRNSGGIGGQPGQVTTAPTTDQQMVEYLRRVDPTGRLATSYLAKQAALTATGTDENGRPTVSQIDPTGLFPGLDLNFGAAPPTAQPPASPSAAPGYFGGVGAPGVTPPAERQAGAPGGWAEPSLDPNPGQYPASRGAPPSYNPAQGVAPVAPVPMTSDGPADIADILNRVGGGPPPVANTPPQRGARPTSNSRAAQVRAEARRAIARGANRDAVRARVRSAGVSDSGL